MRWQVLAALTNGWLWLLAVLTGVVLVLGSAPAWFAVVSAALVLLGGATVQGAVEWRAMVRQRGIGGRAPEKVEASVLDADARMLLDRAQVAVRRAHQRREEAGPDASTLLADTDVASTGVVIALHDLGRQVDRINAALGGIDPQRVQAELAGARKLLSGDRAASAEIRAQRQEIVAGLTDQLAVYRRLTEQRTLALERMRSAAIGLESLAVRLGEIGALASSRGDTDLAERDLQQVADEVETLRVGLVEAETAVRRTLGGLG
jgi:hypothetical protein